LIRVQKYEEKSDILYPISEKYEKKLFLPTFFSFSLADVLISMTV